MQTLRSLPQCSDPVLGPGWSANGAQAIARRALIALGYGAPTRFSCSKVPAAVPALGGAKE
ncbi:MAG: hypothetical protein AMXMBFR61_15660 [Fimbriimonadales bacterium]